MIGRRTTRRDIARNEYKRARNRVLGVGPAGYRNLGLLMVFDGQPRRATRGNVVPLVEQRPERASEASRSCCRSTRNNGDYPVLKMEGLIKRRMLETRRVPEVASKSL